MEYNTYFSKKVVLVNVALTFLIVLLHATPNMRYGIEVDMNYPFIYCATVFCQVGVPMFFFLSALLFYRVCEWGDLKRKLKSRVHSLFIPYLLWNIIFFAIYFTITRIPFIESRMHMGEIPSNWWSICIAIIDSRFTPLWFVRNLLIYVAFSPVLYLLLKNKKVALVSIPTFFAIAICVEWSSYHPLLWLPIYFMGAVWGKYFEKGCSFVGKISIWNIVFPIAFLLVYAVAVFYLQTMYIFRCITPLLIWISVDLLLNEHIRKQTIKPWMNYMFFIYCTHYFLLNVIEKCVVLTLPPTRLVLNITFVIAPIITIVLILVVGKYCSKFKCFSLLTGGR